MSAPTRLLAALAAAATLAACSTTVQLVPEPLGCPLPDEVLAQRCADPATVPDGATFEQVLQAGGRDRDALRQCSLQQRTLAQAMRDCNQALDRYRETLREINRQNQPKR